MKTKQKRGFVSLKIVFDSEYPEASSQELESIIYNNLIAHNKIVKVDVSPVFILEDDIK